MEYIHGTLICVIFFFLSIYYQHARGVNLLTLASYLRFLILSFH